MSYIGFIGGLSGLLSIYQPDKILKIISNEMWNGGMVEFSRSEKK